MTKAAKILYDKVMANLNTNAGYDAYYELERNQKQYRISDDDLCDLAAEFAWDERFDEAIKTRYKRDGVKEYQL